MRFGCREILFNLSVIYLCKLGLSLGEKEKSALKIQKEDVESGERLYYTVQTLSFSDNLGTKFDPFEISTHRRLAAIDNTDDENALLSFDVDFDFMEDNKEDEMDGTEKKVVRRKLSCDNMHHFGTSGLTHLRPISKTVAVKQYIKDSPKGYDVQTGWQHNFENGAKSYMSKNATCVVHFVPKKLTIKGIITHGNKPVKFEISPCNSTVAASEKEKQHCISLSNNFKNFTRGYDCDLVDPDNKLDVKHIRHRQLENIKASPNMKRKLAIDETFPFSYGLERWENCYDNQDSMHEISIGVAVGSRMISTLGSVDEIMTYIELVISEVNVIYLQQLNLKLLVTEVDIVSQSSATDVVWNNAACKMSIQEQHFAFRSAPREDKGLWVIMDDCFISGTIGLASRAVLCTSSAVATTWFDDNGGNYLIVAHEIGHLLGSSHSFEEGQTTTGGIMDYGDHLFNNEEPFREYQFNEKYRKEELCFEINKSVNSCNFWSTVTDSQVKKTCGNGVIDLGEECECPDGKTTCSCCDKCKLKPAAQCSDFENECCTSDCTFKPTSEMCEHSDGGGYCRNGNCESTDCGIMGRGEYCGVESSKNTCRIRCTYLGYCVAAPGTQYYGRPLRNIRDGAFCTSTEVDNGQCLGGECVSIYDSSPELPEPTTSVTPHPTSFPIPETASPTEYPTVYPTEAKTGYPSKNPTGFPTSFPSKFPTDFPSQYPSSFPTFFPSQYPSTFPTLFPSKYPSKFPTQYPTVLSTAYPTLNPTAFPTDFPVRLDPKSPSPAQTRFPSSYPTDYPVGPTPYPTSGHVESQTCCEQLASSLSFSYNNDAKNICAGTLTCDIATIDEARYACETYGTRLCYLADLEQGAAKGTGCSNNNDNIWTFTECSDENGKFGYYTAKGKNGKNAECALVEENAKYKFACCAEAC